MSEPTNNEPELNLLAFETGIAADESPIGSEPLDELLAKSKFFADYVAALVMEE